MKRKLSILLIIVLMVTMMAACGGQTDETDVPDASGEPSEPEPSEIPVRDTLNIALMADIATLDPQNSASATNYTVFVNLYNGLVKEKDGEFYPELAESWKVSEDGLTWTFELKQGIKFHNGEELKASDVAFTMNRAKESPFMAEPTRFLESINAVNDYTVEFVLNQQFAPFLLTVATMQILNEKAVTEAGEEYGKNPVGTGAYKFVEWQVGQKVIIERFDDYFKGQVPIKTVTYKVITDPNTALIALETGDIDFCHYVSAISIQSVIDNPELKVYQAETTNLTYMASNMELEPFNDINFRLALNYALDKETIIQISEEGLGSKATGIWNKLTFGYSDKIKGYEYDEAKAKELVAQSSYDGRDLTIVTLEVFKKGAEVVQENLRDIGINAQIEIKEKNAWIQDIITGNYEMTYLGITLNADADQWNLIFHSSKIGAGLNISRFVNEEVDGLFDKGAVTLNTEERLDIYERLSEVLEEEAVVAPIYFKLRTYAVNKDLIMTYIPLDGYYVEDIRWE